MDTLTNLLRNRLDPSKYKDEDRQAIRKKRANSNEKVMCPRCKDKELKYNGGEHGNSVYCEKMGCIFSCFRGI